jgi:hypothetical protein
VLEYPQQLKQTARCKVQDTTILYQGGSGGFLLFYYMLLSGEYITGLDMDRIEEYIEIQYHTNLASNKKNWKINTEHWPNNTGCKNTPSNKPKLFLFCNPLVPEQLEGVLYTVNDTKILLLYTDLNTQIRMAYNKHAHWFNTWFIELSKRPLNYYTTKQKIRNILKSGRPFNGEICDPYLFKIRKIFPNIEAVNLRDLIQNYPKNPKQQWLIDKWLSLHTNKELRHLL